MILKLAQHHVECTTFTTKVAHYKLNQPQAPPLPSLTHTYYWVMRGICSYKCFAQGETCHDRIRTH